MSGHGPSVKVKPGFIITIIILVFALSLYGFHHHLGEQFNVWGAIYATICFFLMHHVSPIPEDAPILIAQYLAALLLGLGVMNLVWEYFYKGYILNKIKFQYKNHVVIFNLNVIGRKICHDLLSKGYKVVVVEVDSDNHHVEDVKKRGGIVLKSSSRDPKTLEDCGLINAKTCILAGDNDSKNIELAKRITAFTIQHKNYVEDKSLKIIINVSSESNVSLMKDYFDIHNQDEHYDLETINLPEITAKHIFDQFPPHQYINIEKDEEQAIAIIGYNATAHQFLLENLILSHYPNLQNLKVYLVDKDAETHFADFTFKHPYYHDYLEIIPVKLLNETFFANFAWSKKHIEQLSQVKIAYLFGNDDAELMNTAANFRQFLYSQTLSVSQVPLVICMPENDGIIDLLNTQNNQRENVSTVFQKSLNIHQVKTFTDTCNSNTIEQNELNDSLARIINYFYSIKYEFAGILSKEFGVSNAENVVKTLETELLQLPIKKTSITENEIDKHVIGILVDQLNIPSFKLNKHLSIDKRWNALNHRKKDSNRFAARNISVKITSMKNIGCWPLSYENIKLYYPKLASMEHKRWMAEKMVFNFKYGSFGEDKSQKQLLKEVLKIHDQLIPYERLTAIEKEKDLNLFMLLILLHAVKPNHA